MSAAMFEFDLRLVEVDRAGYYHPRWDRAQAITVRGATVKEAAKKAADAFGEPRRNWAWAYKCDAVREVAS